MIRAYVSEHFPSFSVGVAIIHHPNDDGFGPTEILRPSDDTGSAWRWDEIEPGMQVDPTLRLGHAEARALLDALHTHFSGVEDTRALRRDYDGERTRVDKLTDSLSTIAQALARAGS